MRSTRRLPSICRITFPASALAGLLAATPVVCAPLFGTTDPGPVRSVEPVAVNIKSLAPAAPGTPHHHPPAAPGPVHDHGTTAKGDRPTARPIPGGGMSRHGSGTSWQPDASPMWAFHWRRGRKQAPAAHDHPSGMSQPGVSQPGDAMPGMAQPGMASPGTEHAGHGAMGPAGWELMLMGNGFLDYVAQGGPRGVSRLVSQNWAMGMAHRRQGKGELMLRLMMSLEPATVGDNGVPELFQTGEGLIDRQHPHDLFMEIAAQYSHAINDKLAWSLYAAPVGEPALGPVAYPHRISAAENPQTPLAHHLQDSTHISYGVITAGIQSHRWKLEGSYFNAREPDANRWDIDPIRLNSPSVRLWYAPSANWNLQLSRGWLRSPERDEPGDIRRTTASITHVKPHARGFLATALLWGRNDEDAHGGRREDSYALEALYNWRDRNNLFARIERLDRDGLFPAGPLAEEVFQLTALTIGYSRDVGRTRGWDIAVGGSVTLHDKPGALDTAYGNSPVGVHVFLRLRPRRMSMAGGAAHPSPMQQALSYRRRDPAR